MTSYEKGGGDPELAKNDYEYDNQDVTALKEGTTDEIAGEQLHRGLQSRQVSMIAIGKFHHHSREITQSLTLSKAVHSALDFSLALEKPWPSRVLDPF
jgi:hypothetical protein